MKKLIASKKKQEIPWHPNFRIAETLPDIKVIRTDFLVNFVTITLALILAGYALSNEFTAGSLAKQIDDLSAKIQESSGDNSRSLRQSSEFTKHATLIAEVAGFYAQPVVPYELLASLAGSRPEYITLVNVNMREITRQVARRRTVSMAQLELRGTLKGASAEELVKMTEYRNIIAGLPEIEGKYESIDITTSRQPNENIFNFTITILFKPAS